MKYKFPLIKKSNICWNITLLSNSEILHVLNVNKIYIYLNVHYISFVINVDVDVVTCVITMVCVITGKEKEEEGQKSWSHYWLETKWIEH